MEERTLLSGFVVSNTDDSGPGSLRQAILDANAQSGANDITFDPTAFATPQTITLTSGQLELSNTSGTETITGPAAGVTVRRRRGEPGVPGRRECHRVDLGTDDHRGQAGYYDGGGLYNDDGTITLTDCTVNGNSASYGDGGGVYNQSGTVNLIDCTISGNSAAKAAFSVKAAAAAAFLRVGNGPARTTTLTNCTVSGNSAWWAIVSAATTAAACTTIPPARPLWPTRSSPGTRAAVILTSNGGIDFPGQQPDRQDRHEHRLGRLGPDRHQRRAARRRCWHRWATTAARPRPWPCCPAARPSTRATTPSFLPASPPTSAASPHRQRHGRHRRLRVEWVHHRPHLGKRPDSLRCVPRPAGRDGHRQQPDRARGGGPGHIHPAGERSVGGNDGQSGDLERQRHGERHGHEQRCRRQLHRLGHGQRRCRCGLVQPDERRAGVDRGLPRQPRAGRGRDGAVHRHGHLRRRLDCRISPIS